MKRKFFAAFLSLCMVMSLVPMTALAAEENRSNSDVAKNTATITDANSLKTAIKDAAANGTVTIPGGSYEIGSLTIEKAVSLQAAEGATVTIQGQILYKNITTTTSISVQGITFEATNTIYNQAICLSQGIDNVTLTVSDCSIDGYDYGVTANAGAKGTINLSGTTFVDTGCAVSVNSTSSIGTFGNTNIGNGFAVQYFVSGSEGKNNFYNTFDSYSKDVAKTNPDVNGTSSKLVFNETQLRNAVNAATGDDATEIYIAKNITLTSGINVSGKKLNVVGNGNTISYARNGSFDGVFGNSTNTARDGTEITVRDLTIKNTSDTAEGYASVVSNYNDTTTASVTYENCTFINLGAAAYLNPVSSGSGQTLNITNCSYVGTLYEYGADADTSVQPKITTEGNEISNLVYIGETPYASLQAAVDAAQNGDIITVGPGTYNGNVTINKNVQNLTIQGAGGKIVNGTLSVGNGVNLSGLTITDLTFENANIAMSPNNQTILDSLTISNNTFTGETPNSNVGAIHLNLGTNDGTTWVDFDSLTITGNTITNIANGNNSGIIVIGGGAAPDNVTISDNTIDGVGWNGIQINTVQSAQINITDNVIRNCGATGEDGLINLYHSGVANKTGIIVTENALYPKEGQLALSNVSNPVNATKNYWGSSNPDFDKLIGYNGDNEGLVTGTEVYYEKPSMNPQDLNTYAPPANPNYKITIGAMENGTVTANPTAAKAGATVTLTATPDEGYALSTLTVTDRFGDAVRVTEQADGTYTFTMPNGQVTVTATFVETEAPVAEPFIDVAEGDWFYDAVVYAYQNELMDGVGGNRFAPNSETTRAQLVTILYRLEGEPAVSGDLPFTDVEAGIWYTDAILWAAQNNIVNGVSDTEFAPGDDLTRQQLVTILYRYAEAKGYDVSASADLSGYPDADQVQDYAQPAMAWAVAENIIQGMEDGTLKPAGNASRAQIATILMRFCEDVAQ